MKTTYQQLTRLGKTTCIAQDPSSGWWSVTLAYSPLGATQYSTLVRTLTDAEGYTREHNWPVPGDELEPVTA